jgi:hypothetical protein
MKLTLPLFLLFLANAAYAQESSRSTVQLFLGRSFNATGDVFGIEYGGAYSADISKKVFWFAEVGGSIHDGAFPVFYEYAGEKIDASIYYTTAGLQAAAGAGVALLKTRKHEISVRLGAMGRYQSTSYWDLVEVIYPAATGLNFPVARFINTSPKKTMIIGGRGSFSYSYSIKEKFFVSLTASLQADSNEDLLTSTSVGFGKRF